MECPASIYQTNSMQIDYLLLVTQKYYDRSGLNYLLGYAAKDTVNIIAEINEIIRKENMDKK